MTYTENTIMILRKYVYVVGILMPKPKLKNMLKYFTTSQVCRKIGLSTMQLEHRLKLEILPVPTFIDPDSNVKYFDDEWITEAQAILNKLNKI